MMSMSERAITVRRVSCFLFKRSLIIRSRVINRIRTVDSDAQAALLCPEGWLSRLRGHKQKTDGLLRVSSDEIHVRLKSPQNAM